MPITTTSLVQFVLANAQPIVKWQTSFQLCNRSCLLRNLASYSSHSRKMFRRLRNDLKDIGLVYEAMVNSSLTPTKKKLQLNMFNNYLKNLVKNHVQNRHKFERMCALQEILRFKLKNYNENYSELSQELLHDIMMLIQSPQEAKRKHADTSDKRSSSKKNLPKKVISNLSNKRFVNKSKKRLKEEL